MITNILIKNKKIILLSGITVLVYWFLRLTNLLSIPIFTDEAIYLRWSQIMANDAALRFLPLVDGKPPLFMWITSFVWKAAPRVDILLIGRLVAVASGFIGLCGVAFTSYVLFREKMISLISASFYVLVPFFVFYDRIGLADSLLAAITVWSLGLSILVVRLQRLDLAMILGFVLGFGLLTKSPALFLIVYLPLSLIFVDLSKKNVIRSFFKTLLLFGVSVGISQFIYSVLRLFPLFNMIGQKNYEFSLTLSQIIKDPFQLVPKNLLTLISWEVGYLTIPIVLLIVVSLISMKKEQLRGKLLILCYFIPYYSYMVLFNKIIYPRYLLQFSPLLIILAGVGCVALVSRLKNRLMATFVYFLLIAWPLTVSLQLLVDPINAGIPRSDSGQYINSWSAGYGVKEVREFLSQKSKTNRKITIGTEGTFGLMPYALELYQNEYPNVVIKSYWPLKQDIPADLLTDAKDHPTYFIIYQRLGKPANWKMNLISSYRQGNGTDSLRLYEILP